MCLAGWARFRNGRLPSNPIAHTCLLTCPLLLPDDARGLVKSARSLEPLPCPRRHSRRPSLQDFVRSVRNDPADGALSTQTVAHKSQTHTCSCTLQVKAQVESQISQVPALEPLTVGGGRLPLTHLLSRSQRSGTSHRPPCQHRAGRLLELARRAHRAHVGGQGGPQGAHRVGDRGRGRRRRPGGHEGGLRAARSATSSTPSTTTCTPSRRRSTSRTTCA